MHHLRMAAWGLAVWMGIVAAACAEDAAVLRARKTVKMLDDVYKTAVVLITDKYVEDEDDFPAGAAAVAWFKSISEKGWHTVRLIDATGEPYDPDNVAKDDFEKGAIARLKAGSDFVDEVEQDGEKRYLRAATPVPVVLQKCVMCHEHYADAKPGEAIGAVTYRVPIE